MSRTQFLSLIALNAVLLTALALVSLSGRASAQQQRQRGSYMLISSGVTGTPLSVVYVIDETNNELVAMAWDDAGKKMSYVGYRNIAADSMQARRSGR
jgi:hypothetical protein